MDYIIVMYNALADIGVTHMYEYLLQAQVIVIIYSLSLISDDAI